MNELKIFFFRAKSIKCDLGTWFSVSELEVIGPCEQGTEVSL